MKTTMTVTAILACVLALAATADKVDFDWKPVKGATAEYTTTNMHEADMGGGSGELLITWDSTITVEKVDGKKVWLDIDNEEPTVEFDGQALHGVQVKVPDQKVEFGLGGKFYPEEDSSHSASLGIFSGFQFPKDALNPGDSYETGGTKAKFVGVEKYKKWECYKFTFVHKTDSDLWSEGTIWLSTKDLTLIKRIAELHNIDYGMGPEDVTNEIVRRK